jgi:hypothetical protein
MRDSLSSNPSRLLLTVFVMWFCHAHAVANPQKARAGADDSPAGLARTVTIYRDTFLTFRLS